MTAPRCTTLGTATPLASVATCVDTVVIESVAAICGASCPSCESSCLASSVESTTRRRCGSRVAASLRPATSKVLDSLGSTRRQRTAAPSTVMVSSATACAPALWSSSGSMEVAGLAASVSHLSAGSLKSSGKSTLLVARFWFSCQFRTSCCSPAETEIAPSSNRWLAVASRCKLSFTCALMSSFCSLS